MVGVAVAVALAVAVAVAVAVVEVVGWCWWVGTMYAGVAPVAGAHTVARI